MGFDNNSVKLLLHAKKRFGIHFGHTLMIGRQEMKISPDWLSKHLDDFDLKQLNAKDILDENQGYAEPFLIKALEARSVDSIDASDYEGASMIHDLNTPLPDAVKQTFDVVVDGGSLEHIFNFPAAIRNCMELVKLNGHYIGITPCNNFFGHGFYQFSPDLFFRIFSPANGFEILKMWMYVSRPNAQIYSVKDPLALRQRVTMNNRYPTTLFFIARKQTETALFTQPIIQSDYQFTVWTNEVSHRYQPDKPVAAQKLIPFLPHSFKAIIKSSYESIRRLPDLWTIIFRQSGKSNPEYIRKENL